MVAPVLEKDIITADEGERTTILDLVRALTAESEEQEQPPPRLIGPKGDVVDIPEPIFHVLKRAAQLLQAGDGVVVIPQHHEFTSQEAADILGVSRQYVVELCDKGKLPFTKAGAHRRIRCSDLLLYKRQRDIARRKGLRQLAQLSQELGLYDQLPPDVGE